MIRKIKNVYDADDVFDVLFEMSRSGHPDDYIPEEAKRYFSPDGFVIEWEDVSPGKEIEK